MFWFGRVGWAGAGCVEVWARVQCCPCGRICRYSYGRVGALAGVRACGCVGVCFRFYCLKRCISYVFFPAHICLSVSNTRNNTIHIDNCTPLSGPSQRYGFFLLIFFGGFFSPCRDMDPAWTSTSTRRCSRTCSPIKRQRVGISAAGKYGLCPWRVRVGRRQKGANAPEYEAFRPRATSWLCCSSVSCICSLVSPERVIVIVIYNSGTARQHNPATCRQLQFQFVMGLGRFSSLFICPVTCIPRTHCLAVGNAWYWSVFFPEFWCILASCFLSWRRSVVPPGVPVWSQWIHNISFLQRQV